MFGDFIGCSSYTIWSGMKKILVIGGTGFVGRNIHFDTAEFVCYSMDLIKDNEPNPNYLETFQEDFCSSDAEDIVSRLGPDVLIVLAGMQYQVPIQKRGSRRESFELNVKIAEQVSKTLSRVKSISLVVYVSTDMVYGIINDYTANEDLAPKPIGEYGLSKLRAENVLGQHSNKVSILRPRLIAGPGRVGTVELLAKFIKLKLPIPVIGRGHNRYQMISVYDLWRAIELVVRNNSVGVYNVGSENPPPLNELLPNVLKKLGKPNSIFYLPRNVTELALKVLDRFGISPLAPEQFLIASQNCVLDTTKLQELGWRSTTKDEEILIKSLEPLI